MYFTFEQSLLLLLGCADTAGLDGALLSVTSDGRAGDGWHVEEEWLLRGQPDYQLPVP